MSPDMMLPLIASLGWLILCCASLASYRLGWSRLAKMALAWVVIFGGLFLLLEWFMMARGAASTLV